MTLSPRLGVPAAACLMLLATAAPARADVTWFLGTTRRPAPLLVPASASAKGTLAGTTGLAGGIGLLVIGFEVEASSTFANTSAQVPGMKIGMASGIVQTPTGSTQVYAAAGGGLYRESLTTGTTGAGSTGAAGTGHTDLITNIGGGLKLALAGPLRLRLDYRVLHLRGKTTGANVQRFYAGVNVKF